MTSANIVVSDLLFGSRAAAARRGFNSVSEMNRSMKADWNARIKPEDTVYILGDFTGTKAALLDPTSPQFIDVRNLHGKKILVGGNMDRFDLSAYATLFQKVVGCYVYKDCVLTHIPVHGSQRQVFRMNVHGHINETQLSDNHDSFYFNVKHNGDLRYATHSIQADYPVFLNLDMIVANNFGNVTHPQKLLLAEVTSLTARPTVQRPRTPITIASDIRVRPITIPSDIIVINNYR